MDTNQPQEDETHFEEVWEYEHTISGTDKTHWLTEEDNFSTKFKAKHATGATGRIRSRMEKHVVSYTNWVVQTVSR